MNKRKILAALALGLAFTGGSVIAADLENLGGQSCGPYIGVWHFVNNQTDGAAPGLLSAAFTSGSCVNVAPSQVNRNVQHFYCMSSGQLLGATTNLPGRLVLSDFTCTKDK